MSESPSSATLAVEGQRTGVAINLERVSKIFDSQQRGDVAAIREVTLDIAAGSSLLVRGATGCGKTTLLSLIGCLSRPSSGRIRVDDAETTHLHEDLLAALRRRHFGFVFQRPSLIVGATTLFNVMAPALPRVNADRDLTDRARALLAEFGLEHHASERVERLSGGEQQRVALARAMVNDPDVLVADEPTAHQDLFAKKSFLDLVERLHDSGRTVVAASHDEYVTGSRVFTERVELRNGCMV